MWEDFELLETLDKETDIIWEKVKGKLVVSARDYVVVNHRLTLADGTIISSGHSIDYPKRPVGPDSVRANVILAAWIFIPLPEQNGSKAIYVFQVDPKGMIPKMVVNWASKAQCANLNRLRDYVVGGAKKQQVGFVQRVQERHGS
eukprot:TRINITY_DN5043_c0_g1_i5.p2 TRINITY_DN5043_c0_g1~~TRINITY_DN5043_c0_g1_i5.p2  ORF type:complete len:145 (-),score=30.59 TRINITY_DN5043_c0_g1_i5:223-657(-)